MTSAIAAVFIFTGCAGQNDAPKPAVVGAGISEVRTLLPAGPKSAFYDEVTARLWILTLRAADRKVELSSLDPASNNLKLLARSTAVAKDWAGGYFTRSGGDRFVAWGRHIWRFGAEAGDPVDIELPDDVTSASDQPGGISGLQTSSEGHLIVAVNGLSEFVTYEPKSSSWGVSPSGLTSAPSGAFSLAADGGLLTVGSVDGSPDLTARRIAPGGATTVVRLPSTPALFKASNDGALAALSGSSLDLIDSDESMSETEFQTYSATALPIALGTSQQYAWVARVANPQSEGTLELARVELGSGAMRTVDFPVEVRDGGRQGLANRHASQTTYIDHGITAIAVTDSGKAYVLTQCGISVNGSECLYSAVYVVE